LTPYFSHAKLTTGIRIRQNFSGSSSGEFQARFRAIREMLERMMKHYQIKKRVEFFERAFVNFHAVRVKNIRLDKSVCADNIAKAEIMQNLKQFSPCRSRNLKCAMEIEIENRLFEPKGIMIIYPIFFRAR
jgi:hypothetical protein